MSGTYEWKQYAVPVTVTGLEVPPAPRYLVEMEAIMKIAMSSNPRLGRELRYGMPNIMPKFDWWPWIDKAITARDEMRVRLPAAWGTLRHGAPEASDDW